MTIDLAQLVSQFRRANDRENENAYFHTNVPWVVPFAYLNIVFKPVPKDVLQAAESRLGIPPVLAQFLAMQNGAILFSGTLSVYGVVRPGQLLNRSDPFFIPPFSLDDENLRWPPSDPERFLAIGGYALDGSRACIDRRNLGIHLFKRQETKLDPTAVTTWRSLDEWLTSEI